jgi:hypothetical protein
MNKHVKILLLVLLALLAASGAITVYSLFRAHTRDVAMIIRESGGYNLPGNTNSPTLGVQVLKKADGSFSWTLTAKSIDLKGMSGSNYGNVEKAGTNGFFVLDQNSSSLWYADSEQIGRFTADGKSTYWPWGALCQDGEPTPSTTAKRVFSFTNVPPAFRDEVKRVFPKLILPEETDQ